MQSQTRAKDSAYARAHFESHFRIDLVCVCVWSRLIRHRHADLIRDNLHYGQSSSLVLLPERRSYLAIGTFRNKIDFRYHFVLDVCVCVCVFVPSFLRSFCSEFDD